MLEKIVYFILFWQSFDVRLLEGKENLIKIFFFSLLLSFFNNKFLLLWGALFRYLDITNSLFCFLQNFEHINEDKQNRLYQKFRP